MTISDENKALPPHTNRGVESASQRTLESSVDWFALTFSVCETPFEAIRILGLDPGKFVHGKNGKFGYSKSLFYENISVLYGGNENMGIHVEMTGKGCRTFEKHSELDWEDLFIRLNVHYIAKAKVTRIDLAMDDFYGYFTIAKLIKILKKGSVTSLFKVAKHIENIVIKTGDEKGHTLYFGRPESNIQIRFYEKNIEQQMKGNLIPEDCKVWNRTEIQARDDRAVAIVAILASQKITTGKLISGILKNYINFRRHYIVNGKPSTNKQKCRWDVCPFWTKFLGDVEKVSLTMRPQQPTIPRKYNWIDKSVTRTIAILANVWPDQAEMMLETLMFDGVPKMKDDDWDLIYDFRENKIDFITFYNEQIAHKKKAYS